MTTLTAPVKWAQRKDSLYVTISLPDVRDEKIDCSANKITFSGTSSGQQYQVELVLFKEIETNDSILKVLPSSVQMKLNKKDQDDEFWPRLLADKHLEKTNVKLDWDRYVDEDEETEGFDTKDLDGGYNLGGMGGMPGMGGMGGMPGMGGMGGMPGMGGMGGMAGMEEMLRGMGGMGGMGGMDMGGMGMGDDEADSDDGDDQDMPDLEPAEK